MFGSYRPEDVTILLKDITGLVEPMSAQEREARIQLWNTSPLPLICRLTGRLWSVMW